MVKGLNGKSTERKTKVTLQEEGKSLTDTNAGDVFANTFADICNIDISKEKQRTVRSDIPGAEIESEEGELIST